jgi:hypothetical protein
MIENIKNNHVTQMLGLNPPPRNDAASQSPGSDPDATLQVNFADMVNRAMQAAQTDADAVTKAKELLQSGRLITPENIRSAAENILTFGI